MRVDILRSGAKAIDAKPQLPFWIDVKSGRPEGRETPHFVRELPVIRRSAEERSTALGDATPAER